MKHILLSVFLTIVAATAAFAQSESKAPPSKRTVEGQLIELERQLSAALVKEDAAVLDRLWSNDLVFTFPNGKVSVPENLSVRWSPILQVFRVPTLVGRFST